MTNKVIKKTAVGIIAVVFGVANVWNLVDDYDSINAINSIGLTATLSSGDDYILWNDYEQASSWVSWESVTVRKYYDTHSDSNSNSSSYGGAASASTPTYGASVSSNNSSSHTSSSTDSYGYMTLHCCQYGFGICMGASSEC